MQDTNSALIAIITLLSAVVTIVFGGLIWLLKKQFEQSNTTIKEQSSSTGKLADAIEMMNQMSE